MMKVWELQCRIVGVKIGGARRQLSWLKQTIQVVGEEWILAVYLVFKDLKICN